MYTFDESCYVCWASQPEQFQLPRIQKPKIKIGDFVREKSDCHNDALGRFVGLEGSLIKILSPTHKASQSGFLLFSEDREKLFTDILLPLEEVTISQGYSIETLCSILYQNSPPHRFYNLPRGIYTKELCPTCWNEGCNKDSVGVGLINYCGTVMPVVMCIEHSAIHGMLCESFTFNNQGKQWKEACEAYCKTYIENNKE